jgi:hypothetical protein
MKIRQLALIVVALLAVALLAVEHASAQDFYPDAANPSVLIGSVVVKCLNSAGAAVAVSSGQCANGVAIVPGLLTPSAPNTGGAMTLAQAATAQVLFGAGEVAHGCLITNPLSAADQGIAAAEEIWVSVAATAAQSAATTSIPIPPGSSFSCGGGLTSAVSWIATSQGHKISAYKD